MKKLLLGICFLIAATFAQGQIIKSGNITANETWTNNNIYILNGWVFVKAGATVTIEPGTIIKGDFATQGALIVEPNAKLIAIGTPEMPIVFTSQKAAGQRSYGDWGGVILCGNGAVNQPGGTAIVEGGVGTVYGGGASPNNADSSGVLKYVRIEFGGIPFQPNSEINGLTLCGVGSKTVIDHVQVSYCGDDSFEFFGGAVNAKHLIAYRGWDDDFDTDFGYQGNVQFALAVRDPNIADQSGSNGFESDNDGTGTSNTPITNPRFSNVTVVGPYAFSSSINSLYKRALHLRRNTRTSTFNSVFIGYPLGLLIESTNTQSNATNGDLRFKNTVLVQMDDTLGANTAGATINGSFNISTFFNTAAFSNSTLNNVSNCMFNSVNLNSPDFTLQASSPLMTGADFSDSYINNSWFTPVTYRGAFGADDWTECWAEWDPQNQPYNATINNTTTVSIAAGGATTFCAGNNVVLTATTNVSNATYLWSNGATTSSITVTASGNYSVTVKSDKRCEAISNTIAVTVNPLPTVTITANGATSFCTGGSVNLTSSQASGNIWSTSATTQMITVNSTGTYSTVFTDGNGCSATSNSISVNVSSAPAPTIGVSGSTTICDYDTVVLNASTADTYQWNLNGSPIAGETSSTLEVSDQGIYTVTVTNSDPCNGTGTSDQVVIFIDACLSIGDNENMVEEINLYPNPTTTNTTLSITLNQSKSIQVSVVDITGKLIYNETRMNTVKGNNNFMIPLNDVDNGVYFVRVLFGDNTSKIVKLVVNK